MASMMLRRGATALPLARLGRALTGGRGAVGRGLPSPAHLPATTRRALASKPLADGAPQSTTTPSDTAPPPSPPQHVAGVVSGGENYIFFFEVGGENYIMYAINQMRNDVLAEQRKTIEACSVVLHEVKDLRRDLITGKDFLGESHKVMEASIKVHEQVKDSKSEMKSDLVAESRRIMEGNEKVSGEIRELRNDMMLNVADFKNFVSRAIIALLLGIGALLLSTFSLAWPYVLEFLVFLRGKWEAVMKSKGD